MKRGICIAVSALVLVLGFGEPAVAVESAKYTVTLHEGSFEIRDYPASVVAVVSVEGTRSAAVNAGFRLLADYIFGNNQQQAKIAMTAPVTQASRSSGAVEPAAPRDADSKSWTVTFVMPAGSTLKSLPRPKNERVHLEQTPPRRMAAIGFSGFWTDANLQSHETRLLDWLRRKNLRPRSAVTYAYYDPPWKPWFLRRIEALVEIPPD